VVRYDDGSVHEFSPEELRIAHFEHSVPWRTFCSYAEIEDPLRHRDRVADLDPHHRRRLAIHPQV
jgi:hypothetical protein